MTFSFLASEASDWKWRAINLRSDAVAKGFSRSKGTRALDNGEYATKHPHSLDTITITAETFLAPGRVHELQVTNDMLE